MSVLQKDFYKAIFKHTVKQTSKFTEICFEVIMICAGSGIAPFRGFWMRRYEQCQQGHMVGPTFLYFGCRKKSMNLLKDETDLASNSNQG